MVSIDLQACGQVVMERKEDLGFTYQAFKNGKVEIRHNGCKAAQLSARKAKSFLNDMEMMDEQSRQQLMARLTGNYKRGNERRARSHSRNR